MYPKNLNPTPKGFSYEMAKMLPETSCSCCSFFGGNRKNVRKIPLEITLLLVRMLLYPSWELTYPTYGREKIIFLAIFQGDVLVPWRVHPKSTKSQTFRGMKSNSLPLSTCLLSDWVTSSDRTRYATSLNHYHL